MILSLLILFFEIEAKTGKRKKSGDKCYKVCQCETKLIDCHGQGLAQFMINPSASDIMTVTKLDLR